MLLSIVGRNIRRYRAIKNISIEQLSELSGVSPKYLGDVERGKSNISIEKLESLATALDIPPSLLLADEEDFELYDLLKKCDTEGLKQIIKLLPNIKNRELLKEIIEAMLKTNS